MGATPNPVGAVVETTPTPTEPSISQPADQILQQTRDNLHHSQLQPRNDHGQFAGAPQPNDPQPAQDFVVEQTADGWQVRYSTGEVFKGASEVEAYRKAAENAVNNIKYAKELKSKLESQQPVQPVQQQPQQQTPAQPTAEEFNSEAWYNDFLTDPRMAVPNLIAQKAGYKDFSELQEDLSLAIQFGQQMRQSTCDTQFLSKNPDFPNTQEAAQKLISRVEALNLDRYNPEHLAIAHAACLRFNDYQAMNQQAQQAALNGAPQVQTPRPAPVVPSTSPQSTGVPSVDINSTPEQIRAALKAQLGG